MLILIHKMISPPFTCFVHRHFFKGTSLICPLVHKQKPKSEIAAKAVREMNPRMNVTAHQNCLDSNSEEVYDYNFFMGLDGVAAALDNVESSEFLFLQCCIPFPVTTASEPRRDFPCITGVYLDGRCVEHKKPLLEGGTLGSKGHTLVVVPHLTESYGRNVSSSDKAIPLCTLKNFPHRIEHTLQVPLTKS